MVRRVLSSLIISGALVACGGSDPGPSPGDPGNGGPGTPEPGECRETVAGEISTFTTWTNGPEDCDYYVTGDAEQSFMLVTSRLQIEPGTVVVFADDVMVVVDYGGSIRAVGTDDAPVVLTGETETHGSWYGVCFGQNAESRLEHVRLSWAGRVYDGTNSCRAAIGGLYRVAHAPVHIRDTVVTGSLTNGLNGHGLNLGEFGNNTFAGNEGFGVVLAARDAGKLDKASDLSGAGAGEVNGQPYVYIGDDIVDARAHVLPNLSAPYYIGEGPTPFFSAVFVRGEASLDIEAGTEIVMGPGGGLHVYEGGVLNAVGTPGQRITFRGLVDEPGAWDSIVLSDAGPSRISHADISWGGADEETYNGLLHVRGTRNADAIIELDNLILRGSETCGIDLGRHWEPDNVRMSDITFINVEPYDVCD